MTESSAPPARVIGIYGTPPTVADLPPPGLNRWTPSRKAQLARALESGLLSLAEAGRRYALSAEEFQAWQRALKAHGLPGLRSTQVQTYRRPAGR